MMEVVACHGLPVADAVQYANLMLVNIKKGNCGIWLGFEASRVSREVSRGQPGN